MTQNNFKVKHGLEVPSMDSVYLSDTTTPALRPTLNLDFTKGFDSRITFTRASTATYYDGKSFTTGDENLLRYSNDFTQSVWGKTNTTITANSVIGPDGVTQNASTLNEGNLNTVHKISQTAGRTGVMTLSCYVKAGTRVWVRLTIGDDTDNINAWFNLFAIDYDVSINGTATLYTASMTHVGNNWYRCVLTGVPSSNVLSIKTAQIAPADASGSIAYQGTDNYLYIYGAQLESRDAVNTYTETTDTPVSVSFMKLVTAANDVPRIDYDPITQECNGLLIEKARTNLLTYSNDFTNAVWLSTSNRATQIRPNGVVAPDGSLSAATYKNVSGGYDGDLIWRAISGTAGVPYTYSIWIKRRSGTGEIRMTVGDNTSQLVPVSSTWQRYSVTNIPTTTTIRAYISIVTTNDEIDIWGAQLEQELYAGSYIPTTGSQVTTAIDTATISGTALTNLYNQSEGSFIVEGFTNGNGAGDTYLMSVDTSNNTRMSIGFGNSDLNINAPKSTYFYVRDNIVEQALLYSTKKYNNKESARVVATYKANNFAVVTDGADVLTDVSGTVPAVTTLYIGRYGATFTILNGCVKKIQYYPKRLSNESIKSLSTR